MRYTGESRSFPPNTAFGGLRIQNIHVVDVIKVSLGSWETEVPNENGMASQKKRKEEKKEEGISLKKKKKNHRGKCCFAVRQRHLPDRGPRCNGSMSWKLRFLSWRPCESPLDIRMPEQVDE